MIGIDDRRGFALPVAIFVIALLTISLAAVTAMISSERRVLDNSLAQVEALSLGETGLQLFLEDRASYGFTATPPAVLEETRIDLPGGYADVVLELIRPAVAGSNPLYVVRSLGVLTDPALSGTPRAQRMVAQYARWQVSTMNVRAGWMSLSGLRKNGLAGKVSGEDKCGLAPPDCTCQADVAGVSVPNPPGLTKTNPSWTPDGTPPEEDLGTPLEAAAKIEIDWQGIKNRSAITPDVNYPSDPWPPSTAFEDPAPWPIIFVEGDLAFSDPPLPNKGRGILIVTDDLDLSGNITWEGIILAGGVVTSNGNNKIYGATVGGLNVLLGEAVGRGDIGNGTKTFQYDSCRVAQALQDLAGLETYPNAWTDNWPTY